MELMVHSQIYASRQPLVGLPIPVDILLLHDTVAQFRVGFDAHQ